MELILPKYELLDLTKTCWTSRFHVGKEYLCFPAPELPLDLGRGPNLYLTALSPILYFTAVLNLCLHVLRFIVKTCYSYSVHLHKVSVYLHALTF